MKQPIYLDYNATTPVDPMVMEEMLPFLTSKFGNASSNSPMGRVNKEAIIYARAQVAGLIGARPEEIVFTSGGTESNNHAIRGVAIANKDKGRHIITTAVEHPAVTEVCQYLASQGWEITVLPVNNLGAVIPEDVAGAIRPDTTLITIMHANNEVGTIQPISEIGAIAKQHEILFHTDAAQSAGKIETDINKLGVDLLTIAGHKLYAPKGVGALYIRKGIQLENLMFGASQESGIRPGTENVPYIVALGKACEIAARNFIKNHQSMQTAKLRLLKGLKENLGERIHVNSPSTQCLPNTLSVSISGIAGHELVASLSEQVAISSGSACHADSIEVSAVLKAMRIETTYAQATIRISTGKHTTADEIDRAVELISKAAISPLS
jgi:cysteine desulfurase